MENTVSKNGISGYTLKMIAVITMLIDHVGATIVERYLLTNGMLYGAPLVIYYVMRGIGRMAFPIYCYFIVQGFTYTRSRAKYALRLFVFAIASELPFDMALWNSTWDMNHNNVFWTLLLGLLTIWALDVFGNKLVFLDKSKIILQMVCSDPVQVYCHDLHSACQHVHCPVRNQFGLWSKRCGNDCGYVFIEKLQADRLRCGGCHIGTSDNTPGVACPACAYSA